LIFIALLSRVSAHSAGDETGITEHRVELAATADAHKSDAPVPMATTAPSREVVGEIIRYGQMDGRDLNGYLAKPVDAKADTPALLVVHEWKTLAKISM
jgi:dipeptidyl aminopeptidase/acylaminoacyl peptidase